MAHSPILGNERESKKFGALCRVRTGDLPLTRRLLLPAASNPEDFELFECRNGRCLRHRAAFRRKLAPTFQMNEISSRFVDANFAITCPSPNLGLGCRR